MSQIKDPNQFLHDSAQTHVMGTSEFVEDMPPTRGEVYVGVVGSPVAANEAKSGFHLNFETARQHPDYVGHFCAKDLSFGSWGPILSDQPLLAHKQIRYHGEPVAIVVANNPASVMEIVKAVDCVVERPLAASELILTVEKARSLEQYLADGGHIQRGDVVGALNAAQFQLTGSFSSGAQDHFYLESQAARVVPVEGGQLEVYSSTQHPTEVQHVVAQAVGLQFSDVVVVAKRLGGGFGGKESQSSHVAALCALAAVKLNRPARLILSKDQDMVMTGKRHPFVSDFEVGFNDRGEILALRVELTSDGGAYLDLSGPVLQRAMFHVDNAYFIPHISIKGKVARTHLPPNTAFRGFGGPQGAAVVESIMEDIAHHLNLDPLMVRMRNLYQIDRGLVTPYGQKVKLAPLTQLMALLAEKVNYQERRTEITQLNQKELSRQPSCGVLRGQALTPVKFGISFTNRFLNQANSLINVYTDGSVQVSTGAVEMGQGVQAKIRRVVCEILGLPERSVRVRPTSTEKNPNTSATAASSGSDLNGQAAAKAAQMIKARLSHLAHQIMRGKSRSAGEELQATSSYPVEDIIFQEGFVWHRDDTKMEKISFKNLVSEAYFNRISLQASAYYKTPRIDFDQEKMQGSPFAYFTCGAAYTEVEVDQVTGESTLSRVHILMDLGRPLIPGIDRGQICGAFVQGLGWCTNECVQNNEAGRLLTHSPSTYKIPSFWDIPRDFTIEFYGGENYSDAMAFDGKGRWANPRAIRGSKAVGEPPFLLALSAWAAIKDAISVAKDRSQQVDLAIPATGEEVARHLGALWEREGPIT
jgi:xanthine dehydrogenase large subunit